jgi:hypothetical protein
MILVILFLSSLVGNHGICSVVNESIFPGVQQIQGKPHFNQMQETCGWGLMFDAGKYVISWRLRQTEG